MVTDTIDETMLMRRIRTEFDELPGMCLTLEQVARLLGIDRSSCTEALNALQLSGYLTKCDRVYRRAIASRDN
jgi:DNA-binding IclR family transcriptional regulator